MTNFYLRTETQLTRVRTVLLLFIMLLFAYTTNAQNHECGSDYIHEQKMQNDPVYAAKMKLYENKMLQRNNSGGFLQATNSITAPYKIPVVVHIMQDGTSLTEISKEIIQREILRLNQRMRKIQGSLGEGSGVDTGFEFALAVRDEQGNTTDGITTYDLSGNQTYVNQGVKFRSTDAGITEMSLKDLRRWNPAKFYNIWLVNKIGGGNPNTAGGYAPGAGAHGQNGDGSVILAKQFNSLDAVTAHELGHAFNLYHTFEGSEGSDCPPVETTAYEILTIGQMVPATQGLVEIYLGSNSRKYYVSPIYIQNNGPVTQQAANSWGTSSLPEGVYYIDLTQHLLVQTSNGSQRYFIHKNFYSNNNDQGAPHIEWIDSWDIYDLPENVYAVTVGQQTLNYYPSNHCSQSGDRVCDTPRHQKDLKCDTTNSCGGDSSVAKNYMSYAGIPCQNMFTQDQKTRMEVAMQVRKSFLASEGNMSLVPVAAPIADFDLVAETFCLSTVLKLYDNSSNIPNTFLDETQWTGISFHWKLVHESGINTHNIYSQNPTITFNAPGQYTITYKVTNAHGTSTKIRIINVVNSATVNACSPTSNNVTSLGFTVNNVTFNTINSTTDLISNGGYQNLICKASTTVEAGQTYSLKVSINSSSTNPQIPSSYLERFEAYIDWNNNGIFESGELVHSGTGESGENTPFPASVTIPMDAVMNTLLRMRVIGDATEITDAKRNCTSIYSIGDIEDYGVYINGTPICPSGNVTFTSQEQVNQFASEYPNCTQISGFLAISNSSGTTAITNLAPLSGITSVAGSLNISTNSSLTNLNGLSNIVNIGGDLKIADNPVLANVDGLSALNTISGFLQVSGNPVLTSISGLQNINPATIGGNNGLTIANNPLLSVCNLPNLCTYLGGNGMKNIGGNAGNCISEPVLTAVCSPPQCPEGPVTFTTQAQINQFAVDYPNCTAISGALSFSGSDITSLAPLNGITNVGDNLLIQNTSLSNLNGLNNVTTVGGDIDIFNNASLATLNGLNSLASTAGNLVINENAALTNVDALSSLTTINGHLVVHNNATLTTISGLQNVNPNSIGGEYGLYISTNPQLSACNITNLCTYLLYPTNTHPRNISGNAGDCISEQALSAICNPIPAECPVGDVTLSSQEEVNQFVAAYANCTTIVGNLRIGVESGNSNITDISQLYHLVTVTGNVFISYNGSLQNLIGLSSLKNVGGLSIQNNGLNNLNGLSSLTNAGNLLIAFNNSLTNVNGLSGLTSVAGSVIIQNNNLLTNLNGLNNLTTVAGLLTIQDNNALSNISGLQNVNPATLVPMGNLGLTIKNNLVLSVCNLPNFCTYLQNTANPNEITGNGANCISAQTITTACNTTPVNDCPTGTINFTSQAQINQFLIDYPNCTEIAGSLVIGNNPTSFPAPTTNINSLAPLSNITKIGGNLSIDRNPALQNLNGLNNLVHIGGDVLVRVHGTTVGNSTTYPQLPLVGLNNLTSIGGNVLFSRINKFNGLNNLTTVGGDLSIGSGYAGMANGNMDGFSSLTTVGGTLQISTRARISNVDGLNSLTSTGGLFIHHDNMMPNLNGLSNLTSVGGGYISILPGIANTYNTTLTDISGLQNVDPATINGLNIINNQNLTICDLPNLCTYLSNPANPRTIYGNSPGCNLNALLNTCATQLVCAQGDVNLSSQEDVAQFAADYPNCTTISGDLYINGSDITSLAALSNITSLTGDLTITWNSVLTDLSGLSNITSVGGTIAIENNGQLPNLHGLHNLGSNFSGLSIVNNPGLSVCSLPNFCTYLSNPSATHPRNISGNMANCLTEIAIVASCSNSDCPPGDIVLSTQAQVNQFAVNYPNCTVINGNLNIDGNLNTGDNQITNLNGLSTVQTVIGQVNIVHNPYLTGLNGLSSLKNVGGNFWIADNASLTTFNNAFPALETVGTLYVGFHPNLTSIGQFNALTSVTWGLVIENNPMLTNLNGFSNITTVGNTLNITNNATLASISGLQNINAPTLHNLIIKDNPVLSVCNLPNLCVYLSNVTKPRTISGNTGDCITEQAVKAQCSPCPTGNITLTTQAAVNQLLTGYPGCTEISGNLTISGSDITDLSALSGLTHVSGLIITNTNLVNLNALGNLVNLGGNANQGNSLNASSNTDGILIISGNPLLENIQGLQNIAPNTIISLTITDNAVLSVCNLDNFCTYLQGLGVRNISGNAGSCISEQAINSACALSIGDKDAHKLSYYPNPVSDMLYLSHNTQITNVTVTNMLGQIMINQKVSSNTTQIDMRLLAAGNYLVRVASHAGIKTIKVVKQ